MQLNQAMKNDVTIVLDRLRSAFNTGNIIRIADALGIRQIAACGYTPVPPHPKLAKTALGAENTVACRWFPDSMTAVDVLRGEGAAQVLAVETDSAGDMPWKIQYRFPLVLVFGNEAFGVSRETIGRCDGIIRLPMYGMKSSINVGNCVAAVLYSVEAYCDMNPAADANV